MNAEVLIQNVFNLFIVAIVSRSVHHGCILNGGI